MDPGESRKLLPFKPCDQTSNQRLVYEQMTSTKHRDLLLQVARGYKHKGWEAILDRMVSTIQYYTICLLMPTIIERPPLRKEYRQHPRPSPAADLSLPRLRHAKGSRSRAILCARARTCWDIQGPRMHQDTVYWACLERQSDPAERWDSHAWNVAAFAPSSDCGQSGWVSLYKSLL